MKALGVVAVGFVVLFSGCLDGGAAEPRKLSAGEADNEAPLATMHEPREPVSVHDVEDLSGGLKKSWTFTLSTPAKEGLVNVYAQTAGTPLADTHAKSCAKYTAPGAGDQTEGNCGGGVGNLAVQVSPPLRQSFVYQEGEFAAGTYTIEFEADMQISDLHVIIEIPGE